ncbi:hypothetical protein A3H75_01065 [Candidatus Uhrbacteria bacterium RIFCSPLOWO2_02_FULL_51_9]|uniref:Type IV secretion system coupling protein TraD DNA-binding domain-containing protein n=1 Tax=Candidatus Uhrbacteria bacterium RIFCSPLOWO2_02_FULL_51_9 TaxID=1802410 RepID=A0A1F7VD60_9BACT|nr:MAG: hypothetical protein A3H75_01065 [Candidatus Uhrbacteria bacterium RIFCSPLOWO2_02_FULL_51_9]
MENQKDLTIFAQTNFRNENRKFGIKLDDRRRHMYLIGKTGMGKTTMLEHMVLSDIYAGHGLAYIDPHGDTVEKILDFVPPSRVNDVVYFNPADLEYPIGFNILETINPDHKHLVVGGLMGVFKKIWVDQWSARMEYLLNNAILALMDFPGSTLLGVNRMFADAVYRKKVVAEIKDPVIKAFWVDEYAKYTDKFASEATAAIQNKIGQFLSASVIRNIVAQVKSTINIREIMDSGKILLVNLSKGRIGEDNSRLLGGMMVTKIQLSAMERVDIPENERRDFFLYVDEFQNFATESFANILSEARKYRLSLVMAHQYVEQLSEEVAAAVFGNVGSLIAFRVGATDAEMLEKEFEPHFLIEDFVNLPKYNMYLRLMIDGVASAPFSATTIPPIDARTGSLTSVIDASRKNYGHSRAMIEEKIARWSGFAELVPAGGTLEGAEEGAVGVAKAPRGEYTPPPRSAPRQPREERPVEMIKVLPDASPRRDVNPRSEHTKREELPMIVVKPDQGTASATPQHVSGADDRRKRKRHRKKKDGQGGGQSIAGSQEHQAVSRAASEAPDIQDVVLGNPTEKGISLDALKQP